MKFGRIILALAASLAYADPGAFSQGSVSSTQSFNESGTTRIDGRVVSYLIRRLPVDSFPDLPDAIAGVLTERGCLIPQTYQAHHPENVIHGSFERPGSSDWAVLCSAQGRVDLLVFFARAPEKPIKLVSVPELERLQRHDSSGVFGFNWGIDPATPEQVHEARAGMQRHPPPIDHDALTETVLNQKTVYHFYAHNAWNFLEVAD